MNSSDIPLEFIRDVINFGIWIASFFQSTEEEQQNTTDLEMPTMYINNSYGIRKRKRPCTNQSTAPELET